MRLRQPLTFHAILVLGLLALPVVAPAQSSRRVPLVAVLERGAASAPSTALAAYRAGLRELGWVEGQTVRLEIRYADWKTGPPLDALAAELVRLEPDVLWTHSDTSLQAVLRATTTVPVVVGAASDLVELGIVKNLARPGGNVTGMTLLYSDLDRKRVEILKEAVPRARHLGALFTQTSTDRLIRPVAEAAGVLGLQFRVGRVAKPEDAEHAIKELAQAGADLLFVQDAPQTSRASVRIAAAALRHRLPAITQMAGFAEAGGLLQYGADLADMMRRSAAHVDRILKGARPGDLPIEQPTKINLIVNRRTATTLGLTLPASVLVRADRVIE